MSYLLFMDESGHDHKNMNYEVRGGVSIATINVFNFLKDIQCSEEKIFGCKLSEFKTELKGSKLLEKERFKWAAQGPKMSDQDRQKGCRRFLTACLEKKTPTRQDFTAFGQASLEMADTILGLLVKYKAKVFACMVEKGIQKPKNFEFDDYLRKDHISLMESFSNFLEKQREDGLLIMDQCEKEYDKKFKRQLSNYFSKTISGQQRANWIVPEPLFIESDINYLIQVADVCIYIINTGYRLGRGMTAPARTEIQQRYERKIHRLQYSFFKTVNGKKTKVESIKLHKNPYQTRKKR